MHKAVSFIVWHSLKNMEVEEKLSQIIWGLYVDFYFESLSNYMEQALRFEPLKD